MKPSFLGFAAMLTLASPANAAWDIETKIDPMTDVQRGFAFVAGDHSAIAVKCDKHGPGQVYILLYADKYLGEGRYGLRKIKYRIDDGTPVEAEGSHRDKSVLLRGTSADTDGGKLLSAIASGKKMVLQLTSFDFTIHTSIIDISGGQAAIRQVAKTCEDTNISG